MDKLFEFITSLGTNLTPPVAAIAIIFLCLFWLLVRVINADNPIDWWHFIASKNSEGNDWGDIDKLGKVVGIIVSSIIMIMITLHDKMDALIMGVYLAFVGGVAGYSAYLRAKHGVIIQPPTNGNGSSGEQK